VEQVIGALPRGCECFFYRTHAGAEVDLVVERPGRRPPLAIEIKASAAPKVSRGFWSALQDLEGARGLVICPAIESYPLGLNVDVLPIRSLATADLASL